LVLQRKYIEVQNNGMSIFLIWLSGFFVSYGSIRLATFLDEDSWRLKERCQAIALSLLSWGMVLMACIYIASFYVKKIKIDWDRPVKW
jgi:hypothetical protein